PDPHPEPLYSKDQIIAFTIGDHRECFGDTYANFGSRRIPRLPNGYLRFIDRIMDIQPSANNGWEGYMLNSEFDLPSQSWYRDDQFSAIPAIAIMELALQPCGFLSAYLGSIKDRGNQDLYFRNLDGEGTLLHWPEKLEGKILNHVELLSSSSLGEVIIQNYSFKLSWGGNPFYEGTSSFGYFSLPMLENQSGLDGNQIQSKWVDDNPRAGEWIDTNPQHTVPIQENDPHLPQINRLWIAKSGGLHEQGYIYVKQSIPVQTWFYKAHFYQDPVMPGSLGVETIIQALITGLSKWGLPENVPWRIAQGQTTNWKYRGQIIPGVEELSMELHLKHINAVDQGWQVIADCHLWKGPLRIYQIENLALETY
ncbi:MAG: hypothetical protein MUP11_04750, partial [Anaerolineales bacterium]|nr:hypothetical protein [Anaerolineales bacterium]